MTTYISEATQAKYLNILKCVNSIKKMYEAVRMKDYVMGGINENSHGMRISIKRDKNSVFIAMPGFLGGEYQVAGLKWHGPNIRGSTRGSTNYTLILNEPDTGTPIALFEANLLTAYRTAALSLYATTLLKQAQRVKTIGLIGGGEIHTIFLQGLLELYPNINLIKIKSKTESGAEKFISNFDKFKNIRFEICQNVNAVLDDSDLISVNPGFDFDSLSQMPLLRAKYIKENALVLCLSYAKFSDEFLINGAIKVADNFAMYESYLAEFGYPVYPKFSSLGSRFIDLVYDKQVKRGEIVDIVDILNKTKSEILAQNKPVVFASGGMIIEDIAVACDLLKEIKTK
ncbi:hypothetical protein [Campylobacter hyointestinalis]|uniref:hypothetical protein n=1 Tax=Campylobacter hyointestinalis TaxID=198 RepID=UPI000DCDA50C|nr:hypothetical protein [Campylobacter hyointestinalis]RAZ40262.1 hypothetical protein CHL9426_01375 [Campylobacter hyointestinalis subsp. lawsonii]RAZ60555.1 hypothetical protein CHL10071_05745 [Campylobacter hyointestinalis subsp. lawsonii]